MTSPIQSKPETHDSNRFDLAELFGSSIAPAPARPRLKTGVSASAGWAAQLERKTSAHRDQG